MGKKKYDCLREQYPEYVSLDQLYRICGIAKRSALYLIRNDIIPSIDTEKRTWRYKIALDDVITYLRRREQWGSMIPPGAVSSRTKHPKKPRRTFASLITQGEESAIAEYFAFIYNDYPDVLTTPDIVEMTGFAKRTVLQLLKDGEIDALRVSGKYMIPKQYLLSFVQTPRFIEAKSNSENYIKILGGFEIWKTAKS
jgi:hypothetical protein